MSLDISAQLHAAAERSGRSIEGVAFVWKCLEALRTGHGPGTPVDAGNLCRYVRDAAVGLYGRAARMQLEAWSIRSWEDVGAITVALADVGWRRG